MAKKAGSTNKTSRDLTSQLEDYLEAIALIQEKERVARAKDIADRLGVTRATVTSALRSLSEKGLINYQPYSHITLTKSGERMSSEIIRRHHALTDFLKTVLQLPQEQANDNACRAEHVLDRDVIERMICFVDFLKACPRTNEIWRHAYDSFCENRKISSECKKCISDCIESVETSKPK